MAEFKKISDVDVINTLSDNDNVVIIGSDGAIKQTSSGNFGGKGLVITPENPTYVDDHYVIAQNNYDEFYDALIKGAPVVIETQEAYFYKWGTGGYWGGESFGDLTVTNSGYSQGIVSQWEITDIGLILGTAVFAFLFPNGSHNLPKIEAPVE